MVGAVSGLCVREKEGGPVPPRHNEAIEGYSVLKYFSNSAVRVDAIGARNDLPCARYRPLMLCVSSATALRRPPKNPRRGVNTFRLTCSMSSKLVSADKTTI